MKHKPSPDATAQPRPKAKSLAEAVLERRPGGTKKLQPPVSAWVALVE
jgi:hypothetical protein